MIGCIILTLVVSTPTIHSVSTGNVIFYYGHDGAFYRSFQSFSVTAPTSAMSGDNRNGQVNIAMSATNPPSEVDMGFTDIVGPLSNLHNVIINPVPFAISGNITFTYNLFFRTNQTDDPLNGEFFAWNNSGSVRGNTFTGLNGDVYALCQSNCGDGKSSILTTFDNTTFFMIPSGHTYTFAQLNNGTDTQDGITPQTIVGLYTFFYEPANGDSGASATFGQLISCSQGGVDFTAIVFPLIFIIIVVSAATLFFGDKTKRVSK